MERKGKVFLKDNFAGTIWQDDEGYHFQYDAKYLSSNSPMAVSLTLPLQQEPYTSKTMIPFFDGLIPEGWLLNIAVKNWKLDPRDRMGLLITVCKDCIGAISVIGETQDTQP